jgi:hypothetical protein
MDDGVIHLKPCFVCLVGLRGFFSEAAEFYEMVLFKNKILLKIKNDDMKEIKKGLEEALLKIKS